MSEVQKFLRGVFRQAYVDETSRRLSSIDEALEEAKTAMAGSYSDTKKIIQNLSGNITSFDDGDRLWQLIEELDKAYRGLDFEKVRGINDEIKDIALKVQESREPEPAVTERAAKEHRRRRKKEIKGERKGKIYTVSEKSVQETIEIHFEDQKYRSEGLPVSEIADYLGLKGRPKVTNIIKMVIGRLRKSDKIKVDVRDSRVYPVGEPAAPAQEPKQPISLAAPVKEAKPKPQYVFPDNLQETQKLESSGVLDSLYRTGNLVLESGFIYGSNGPVGKRAVKVIKRDLEEFLKNAGFRGNPRITLDLDKYKLILKHRTYMQFRAIMDSRRYR